MSSSGYADGFGRRTLAFDRVTGSTCERLTLRGEFGAFERAIRERAAALQEFDDERFARVREVRRLGRGRVAVDSEQVPGERLSDLLDAVAAGPDDRVAPGVDVAVGFLLEILPALGALHAGPGMTHGAVDAGRLVLTPAGQIILLDAIYAQVLERMRLPRARLWNEFRLALPASAGPSRFDAAADVGQASLTALTLVLGRPLATGDFPAGLPGMIEEAIEIAQIRGNGLFASRLRGFFERTLPLPGRRPFTTSDQAADELLQIAETGLGLRACRAALAAFGEDMRRAVPAIPPAREPAKPSPALPPPAVVITITPPAPVPSLSFDPALVEAASVPVQAPAPQPAPAPAFMAPPPPAPDPVPHDPPAAPASGPEPADERAPQAAAPPEAAAAEPLTPAAAAAPVPASPAEEAESAAAPSPRRKRDKGPRAKRDKLRSADPPAVALPPDPPRRMPMPVGTPAPAAMPIVPQPSFGAPAAARTAASPYMQATGRVWEAPPAPAMPAPPVAAPAIALVQPVPPSVPTSSGTVRIKAEPPPGYTPPRPVSRHSGDDGLRAMPQGRRGAAAESASGFPWKIATAAVVVVLAGAAAGRAYLPDSSARTTAAAGGATAPSSAAPSAATTGTLVVTTQPEGARVLIDGKPAGASPLTLDTVPPGRRTITLIGSGGTVKRAVRIEAGKTVTLDVPIISGWVAVDAPFVVDVAAGGRALGNTQQPRLMLPPGVHRLTFTNKSLGYTETQSVEIEPGEERRVSLNPRGAVNLNAQPWAEVWIDGARVGETPLANLAVALGAREIVFKHPQYGERRVTPTIRANAPTAISIDMTKAQ